MTTPDPAAELREAARLMRMRAGEATPGPWREMHLGSEGCIVLRACATIRDRARVALFGWKEWKADHADAEYVASMHPLVALALADWLEATAIGYETLTAGPFGEAGAAFVAGFEGGDLDPAIAVARAYLGTEEKC